MDNVYGAVIMTQVIARVHPVHLTNAKQRQCQAAADPQNRPTNPAASPHVGCYMAYIHYRNLLLLSRKADTHFTVPRRVEG